MRHESAPRPTVKDSLLAILTRGSSPFLAPFITSLIVITLTLALSFAHFGAIAMDYVITGFFLAVFMSVSIMIFLRFFQEQLDRKENLIDLLCTTDPLTGLVSRRHFYDLGRQEFQTAQRESTTLCLVIVSLSNLKQINSALGHMKGDELLARVAQHLKNVVRANDILARYSGHEFAILLYGCEETHSATVTERVMNEIDKLNQLLTHPGIKAQVTIKSACLADHMQTFDRFIDCVRE